MKRRLLSIVALVVSLSSLYPINAQTSPQQRTDDTPVRIRATEVSLDVTVKDKKGRPVKDLSQADFEVYEDGVKQQIESFRVVSNEAMRAASAGGANRTGPGETQPAPPRERDSMGLIALVFDRLSPEARNLARKAGMAYATEGLTAGDYAGVFGIDQSLATIQLYTDNAELIKQAVDRATSTAVSSYASTASKVRGLSGRAEALDQVATSQQSAAAAAGAARDSAGASAAGAASGQAMQEQTLIAMETRILEAFETLERDQQGFATINSLLAVVSGMRKLPGRKTIIFFSEGLALPSSVQTKFPSVISAANQARVSIYAVDAGGLRIESGNAEAAAEINSIAAKRMQQQARGNDRLVSEPYTKALERNEDLLMLDSRSGLGRLADQTGGFLIHDTNDLTAGVRRIDDDMRQYYLLTYMPKNRDMDGRFRNISVKVNRSNVDTQTRKGYYAVESVGQLPLLDYEAPAIAAARNARPGSLPVRSAALSFPAPGRPGLTLLMAEAPISAFTLSPSNDKKNYGSNFSFVALVRDESNQIVQKLSQNYPLSVPKEKLDGTKKEDVLFYREVQLNPGRYTIELIAFDAPAGKAAVHTTVLEVPAGDASELRLSSVVVLKRAERLSPEEQKRDQPFHFGELIVYPNLGEPIAKSVTKQLAFFFTAWPAKGSSEPPEITAEVLQNTKSLGRTTARLPAADDHGRIKYASALPTDAFQPGSYDLKITLRDGKTSVSRTTRFTVQP